jgi:hypothetical protein
MFCRRLVDAPPTDPQEMSTGCWDSVAAMSEKCRAGVELVSA